MSDKTLTSQWAADKRLEEISYGHQSHDWMASKVRMLMRNDLDHELVCTGARDRIVWLAARVAELEAALSARASAGEGVVTVCHSEFVAARGEWKHTFWTQSEVKPGTRLTAAPEPAQAGASGGGGGMLPDALVPHQKEWYRLCERRFAVERITISGELAEAIVNAICQATPASPATGEDITEALHTLQALLDEHGDSQHENALDVLHGHIRRHATPQPAAASEWVMVPREPTTEMLMAAGEAVHNATYWGAAYRAMLAAAPQPQAVDCGEAGHKEGRCGNAQCMASVTPPAHGDGEGINPHFWIQAVRTNAHVTDCKEKTQVLLNAADALATYLTTRPTPEAREYRLFDSQWVNVVNHAGCYRDMNKEDAVAQAVKLTEQAMAANINDCKWPRPRKADAALALPAQGEGRMAKSKFDWREAFNQAVNNVRANASHGEWYAGYKAGASAVAVEMYRLEREAASQNDKEKSP